MRTVALTAALSLMALSATACDDDDNINEQIEDQTVPPGSTGEGDVPFDPDVPDGVDTETDESGNQGFDGNDSETGNVTELDD